MSDANESFGRLWLRKAKEKMAEEWATRSVEAIKAQQQPPATGAPPEQKQRLRAQERAILAKLVDMGHNPKVLPKNQPGKAGVPSMCKKKLSDSPLFEGVTTFDKAWERLAKDEDIKYSD